MDLLKTENEYSAIQPSYRDETFWDIQNRDKTTSYRNTQFPRLVDTTSNRLIEMQRLIEKQRRMKAQRLTEIQVPQWCKRLIEMQCHSEMQTSYRDDAIKWRL